MDSALPDLSMWESVKTEIFKEFTTWDMLISKVRTQQPDDTRKRMQRLLEEVEYILSMFNKVLKESYPGYSCSGITTMTAEQLKKYNFVLPDIHVSQFLGIPAQAGRVYFIDDWDSPSVGQPSEVNSCFTDMEPSIQDNCQKLKTESVSSDADGFDPSGFVKTELESEDSFDPLWCTESVGPGNILRRKTASAQDTKRSSGETDQKISSVKNTAKYHADFPVSEEQYNMMKSGEIPMQCPKCDTTFGLLVSMVRHFKYDICGRKQNGVHTKGSARDWHSSFPIDKETFEMMKAGTIQVACCDNCKFSFTRFDSMYKHFTMNTARCKKEYANMTNMVTIGVGDASSNNPM